MSRQPDLTGLGYSRLADLHQEKDNLPGKVPGNPIHVHVPAPGDHVDQLDVVEIAVVDRLVHLLVLLDPGFEVGHGLIEIYALVIGTVLHFVAVVLLQDHWIVADALDEHVLVLAVEALPKLTTAFFSGISGVEYGYLTVGSLQVTQ
eukprot:CAMPEP_0175073100 /NCGR_PEP_ID=MMETSP0052_2-20121109/20336_1 /TAXON_ID=51329 ORGANISM="Polytomella parva, Strain SAG 63-3" /NCGR_SAMPLE_ID=MMETSP0052_2 /ASSEMBLY_ACC=CAM_ASM_000194 /LENGTH=146 /DNA_ID=CAMNT_0016340795 /DNA_START=96 /DNA_END=536 /DNA_ORIENTATION=+